MNRYLPLVALVALVAAAITISRVTPPASATAEKNVAAARTQLANLEVGPGVRHGNLTIWPVVSRSSRMEDPYITLDEGLASGKVEIYEVGADGNRITRQSIANEPATPQVEGNQSPQSDNIQQAAGEDQAEGWVPVANFQQTANVVVSGDWEPAANLQQAANLADANNVAQFSQGNEVNRLVIVNRSGKPLYLMTGEVIVGGSQDRTIAQERVIASSDEPVSLDVFCVEHGRWGGRGGDDGAEVIADLASAHQTTYSNSLSLVIESPTGNNSPQALASTADSGRFVLSAGNLNKSGRLAVLESKDQHAVWNDVQATVDKSQSMASLNDETVKTGSFTGNYSSAELAKHLEPYLSTLHAPVNEKENVVGVIVAINDNVETFDVFESTPLFRKLWPKLLKSYALDALQATPEKTKAATPTVTVADARRFLTNGMLANISHSEVTADGLEVYRCPTNGFLGFSARRADAVAVGGFGTMNYGYCQGADSPWIHSCGFAAD